MQIKAENQRKENEINKRDKLLEYDDKGRLVFEGGLLYGKKHGKGKEYQYGNLIFFSFSISFTI